MRHVLIGLRAFGEAVFWGTVGGGAYGLVLAAGDGTAALNLAFIAAVFGLAAGVATGVVGAGSAALMSATEVSDRTCRIVAAAVSGICIVTFCWSVFSREAEGLWETWLENPQEWLTLVVGPGLAAVAMGAWRGPAILRSDVPQLRRRGDVVA